MTGWAEVIHFAKMGGNTDKVNFLRLIKTIKQHCF